MNRSDDDNLTPAEADDSPGSWTIDHAAQMYGINAWANGFFEISAEGDVAVRLTDKDERVAISLPEIVRGARDRGLETPLLLRFPDILARRLGNLNRAFNQAIAENDYQGDYRGVYPVKVNQQQQVIREITRLGRDYHFGLEVGSKPELLASLAYLRDPQAWLICNGYKDREFIDLALCAVKMGLQAVLVVEMPGELDLILDRADALNVKPILGVRVKLATENDGRWARSSGERSVFGLTAEQVMVVVDKLRAAGRLDCLNLLHYHQGSQVPDIRAIRDAAMEATRIYVELAREGAAMRMLDIGGGLAVDYDGTKSNSSSSRNYGMLEYAGDVIDVVMTVCDESNQPHPDIISESGRAIAAYYSVLVFNILDANRNVTACQPPDIAETPHPLVQNLVEVTKVLADGNLQECYNDALYYRGELLSMFNHGLISLRERSHADKLFWQIISRVAERLREFEHVPDDLRALDETLFDVYYGNFSLFQSLPDAWAIDQIFPVMPIHRLNEQPHCRAVLADITCDCDGRIDEFLHGGGRGRYLPLHALRDGEDYLLGVFLVGAYQETLGDLHNLLGDTNVVSVSVKDGRPRYVAELRGDTIADVLSYVEYDPKRLIDSFRRLAESAVQQEKITPQERRTILARYEASIHGYTYYES